MVPVRPSTRLVLGFVVLLLAGGVALVGRSPGSTPEDRSVAEQAVAQPAATRRVLAISLDGLNPTALRELGRERVPHLVRLLRQGAATLNARSQVELTLTLPNHTSMVTGRRIDADRGGHGVTWNEHRPGTTVQRAAGEPVSSVFTVVHRHGGSTALYATEQKLSILERSWPAAIDRTVIRQDGDGKVTRAVRRDLVRHDRAFTFLHLGLADEVGHAHGWLSAAYLDAVVRLDRLVGTLLRAARRHESLAGLVVVLTADHGGVPGTRHHDATDRRANYRVPFVVWGPGVARDDLYDLSPRYADPGRRQVGFAGEQPVRNGDLANLATDLLGLRSVPGSRWDRRQALHWR